MKWRTIFNLSLILAVSLILIQGCQSKQVINQRLSIGADCFDCHNNNWRSDRMNLDIAEGKLLLSETSLTAMIEERDKLKGEVNALEKKLARLNPKPVPARSGAAAQRSTGNSESGWLGIFTLTAYCANCNHSICGGGTTATGTKARNGVIAVDPDVIPLGSRVEIEGYGVFSAEDTGGSIKGYRIDICREVSHTENLQFGRRKARVRVL